jgi:hypothetical protein
MTADGSSDSMAIVRVPSVHFQVGVLGQAAGEGVADAPLVDRHRPHGVARRHQLGKELVQRVALPGERGRNDAECLEDPGHRGRRQREPELQHRLPPLQPVGVDLPEQLDVHQAGADLDVGASRREQVELVALLDRVPGQRGQGGLRGPEALAEDAPFPARDDRGHGCTPRRAATGPARLPTILLALLAGGYRRGPGVAGGRSHSVAVAGCMVWSTTASSSPCSASRSTWSRSRAAKASRVRAAS